MIVALCFILIMQYANGFDSTNERLNITWESQLSTVKSQSQVLIRRLLPKLYKMVMEANISGECERSLMAFAMALMQWKTWAIRIIDASAKIPSGILEGATLEFGSYRECLEIKVQETSRNSVLHKELFRGQYCTLGFQPNQQNLIAVKKFFKSIKDVKIFDASLDRLVFSFGFCVPSTCSKDDILNLSSVISQPLGIKSSVLDCSKDEPFVWQPSEIAAVSILCILISLCIVGTTLDYLQRIGWKKLNTKKEDDKNLLWKILQAFSILMNFETFLMSCGDNDIGCFHGIRALTAAWIIYGHNYHLPDLRRRQTYSRLIGMTEKFGYLSEGLLENFTLSVSTFFVMSGFLLTKTSWKRLEKNDGKLNFLEFLRHKYWRLTPALAFTLTLLYALQVIDSGPLWNPVINDYKNQCDGYWWALLLYFSNCFSSEDKLCLPHTWFVSALMQLHIIGFILLLVTYRWKKCGILTGLLLSVVCFATTAYVANAYEIPVPIISEADDLDKADKYVLYIYMKPYFHVTSYLTGMTVAYLLEKYSSRNITKKYLALGWILSVILALYSIYAVYIPTENKAFVLSYHMIHRTTWAIGLALFLFICASGHGGLVNKFLSCQMMKLIGQLSYLMYLTHYLVFIYKYASAKEKTYFGNTEQVFLYISVLVITLLISLIGHLTVEIPFAKLEHLVFRRQSQK